VSYQAGCRPPEITPELIACHRERAHALRAQAFAAAGRWLAQALLRPFADRPGRRVVHG
jgi:hypothetical protein